MGDKRLTTLALKEMKQKKEKIAMITAYDYPTAQLVDEAGSETILVGDSLGMVVLGYKDTLSVTLDDMIHHGKAVVRGSERAFVIIDMPFLTYEISAEEALRNAGRVIQQTGAQGVKVEGGTEIAAAVKSITEAGIPVVGHLGLTPQSVGQLGGFKVQGKTPAVARKIIEDALALEEAGAFMVVLECIPWQLAEIVTEKVSIPTIGMGQENTVMGKCWCFMMLWPIYGQKTKICQAVCSGPGDDVKRGKWIHLRTKGWFLSPQSNIVIPCLKRPLPKCGKGNFFGGDGVCRL